MFDVQNYLFLTCDGAVADCQPCSTAAGKQLQVVIGCHLRTKQTGRHVSALSLSV